MLLDDGVLVLKEDEWVATVDLTTVQVPPAISALLAARLDRLSSDERLVLEAASVVGEVFEPDALRSLIGRCALPVQRSSTRCSARTWSRPTVLRRRRARGPPVPPHPAPRRGVRRDPQGEVPRSISRSRTTSRRRSGARSSEFDEFIGYHLEQATGSVRSSGCATTHRIDGGGVRASGSGRRPSLPARRHGGGTNLLSRAADLVPVDDPGRLRMGWGLGQAMIESGATASATRCSDHDRPRPAHGDERAPATPNACSGSRGSSRTPKWTSTSGSRTPTA